MLSASEYHRRGTLSRGVSWGDFERFLTALDAWDDAARRDMLNRRQSDCGCAGGPTMSSDQSENGSHSTTSPARLSHAVLRTTRLKEMIEWYKSVLGAQVLYETDFAEFMTYDDEQHTIPLFAV